MKTFLLILAVAVFALMGGLVYILQAGCLYLFARTLLRTGRLVIRGA